MSHVKKYYPTSKFIPDTSIPTNIDHWEVVGKRAYTVYKDGFRCKSEYTPGDLAHYKHATTREPTET